MRHRPQPKKNVVCIHSLHDYAGQEHFAGVLDFCRNRMNWAIKLIDPEDLDEATARQVVKSRPDGVIITLPGSPAAMKALFGSSLPTVIANVGGYRLPARNKRISFVWTDNADIGEKGARFLLSLTDFRSYAFADVPDSPFWAKERGRAFCEHVGKFGKPCTCHAHGEPLGRWLADLPKPAAVMAANDMRAAEVIETCRQNGFRVPEDVAVLGVDNEPALRARFQPQISSIHVDFFRMGFREAEELDRLISSPRAHGTPEILIPADDVIPRHSTRRDARAEGLARKIRDYIAAHALDRIRIPDIVRSVGCSRRLAELRFRQATGTSIRREIETVRLARAIELLKTTGKPKTEVAQQCGFPSAAALARALQSQRRALSKAAR